MQNEKQTYNTVHDLHSIVQLLNSAQCGEIQMNSVREQVIRLLSNLHERNEEQNPLVNALCRQVGLYPYIKEITSTWEDAFAKSAFYVTTDIKSETCLHLEQSRILKRLLGGANIALSAPTSFGKTFIIDAYIAIKKPVNVVIIVPTLALMDESRRRLAMKFSEDYNIITQPGEQPDKKNIYIFPQERSFSYIPEIGSIDILIVDEFYKASLNLRSDKRVTILQKAIVELSRRAKQRYYLMPNVDDIDSASFLMKGMEFEKSDFQTVCLDFKDIYAEYDSLSKYKINKAKSQALKSILAKSQKTLVYACNMRQIHRVISTIIDALLPFPLDKLVEQFSKWVALHYGDDFYLVELVRKGIGVHNGRFHRSLCQFQVDLFDKHGGLFTIISTSSMIEGVNTSAENVVLWSNSIQIENNPIDYFTYRNIAGRAGRMFQYFVGKVYNLEKPPTKKYEQLELSFTEDCTLQLEASEVIDDLQTVNADYVTDFYSRAQQMGCNISELRRLLSSSAIKMKLHDFMDVVEQMKTAADWDSISILNRKALNVSERNWDSRLSRIIYHYMIKKLPDGFEAAYFIPYVILASRGWHISIPTLIDLVNKYACISNRKKPKQPFNHDRYFRSERIMTYDFQSLLNDYNLAYNLTHQNNPVNIDCFLSGLSNAFLPGPVFALEELGLPRFVSKRLHEQKIINFSIEGCTVRSAVNDLKAIGLENILKRLNAYGKFEEYILRRFFAGV